MALGILNTAILTEDGSYEMHTLDIVQARALVSEYGGHIDSAVGHAATADILSELLSTLVPVNRQLYRQRVGGQALVFKLNGRAPEGAILDRHMVEKIGYTLKVLTRNS